MRFEDLSEELQQKAKACETPEEILALAKNEGIELSDEDLESLSGGIDLGWSDKKQRKPGEIYCPKCDSDSVWFKAFSYKCAKCGYEWPTQSATPE